MGYTQNRYSREGECRAAGLSETPENCGSRKMVLLVSGYQQKQTTRQSLLALYVDILGDASHARPAVCFNVHAADAWRCHVYISRGLPSCKFRDGRL